MVASQFIDWTAGNTAMFAGFLVVMLVLFGIAYLGVRGGIGFLMPITVALGLAFFGLLGVLVPHRLTVGADHHRMALADIRAEYPQLAIYNLSVGEHWAWVRLRNCDNSEAVQVPMYRQPTDSGRYWLINPTLVVAHPKSHMGFSDINPHDPLLLTDKVSLCPNS